MIPMKPYDISNYDRPSVAVDAVVFSVISGEKESYRQNSSPKLAVLLIRRGEEPFRSRLALPGGFLRREETIEHALERELLEETGISSASLTPLANYSAPDRDPRGWIISCASLALIPECDVRALPESDADSAGWYELDFEADSHGNEKITLSSSEESVTLGFSDSRCISSEIAFDHAQIIYDGLMKLRELVRTGDTLFSLLPELFKISEMQAIYELVLDKKDSPANFRRKMMNRIEETEMSSSNEGHRPSKLYRKR